ncbi:MAG: hypothetical protein HOK41_05345 [Nitrospina sp.]|jgi:hypothetical protein|nr:hypothetical protein [Nitrospina sp.]
MKKALIVNKPLLGLLLFFSLLASQTVSASSNAKAELEVIKKDFGAVLKLKGAARKEINAIANLFSPDSKLAAIDIRKASGEFCMLETVTKHNMTHFSSHPESTHEDIVYYLNPKTFIENGLDVNKLPRQPEELGKMVPMQWYYYDGTYVEPHQGTRMNKEFVIMTVNVK